ncbi:MAG: glycogen synthase GlgA [Asticcacaulis sp.]
MTTLLPAYPAVKAKLGAGDIVHKYKSLLGVEATITRHDHAGQAWLLLDAPALFDREGGPYTDAKGIDWPDNWQRFAALGKAASDLAGGAWKAFAPDLVHTHDWQAAMAPVYMRYAKGRAAKVPSIVTIHNLAFQGRFGGEVFGQLGLPDAAWTMDGVEYYGDVSFLKGALLSASRITTVSPTYAEEIRTPEFGMGLEGVICLRGNDVTGIVNGIDCDIWNPESDAALAASFSAADLSGRRANKAAIEAALGLEPGKGPLFCVVSRLTGQKGIDVLADLFDDVVAMGARLAILGAGDPAIQAAVVAGAARHPGRIGVKIGYDEAFSHLLQGGSDAILIPSRFEPCGLTQLYGLRYGCVPVVARTGGLADTIIDANTAALGAGVATGFQFVGVTHDNVRYAIRRAVDAFAPAQGVEQVAEMGHEGRFFVDRQRRALCRAVPVAGQGWALIVFRPACGAEDRRVSSTRWWWGPFFPNKGPLRRYAPPLHAWERKKDHETWICGWAISGRLTASISWCDRALAAPISAG